MSEHELWNELGNLYFLSGSYEQAANAYRRSIQLEAGFGRPYSNLALTYVQQGKYEDAIELYRRSIELLADSREKAVSWNRLGTVYRHLKDYSRAVIAFQEADELDPQTASEFPALPEAPSLAAPAPASVLDQPAAPETVWWEEPQVTDTLEATERQEFTEALEPTVTLEEPAPQLEAAQLEAAEAIAEGPAESWTEADPSQFQQDISQAPHPGSLTTWGEPEYDDEFEVFPPRERDDGDPKEGDEDLSTWLPIPEEEPWSADELPPMPPFFDELFEDMEFEPPEPEIPWNIVESFPVIHNVESEPSFSTDPGVPLTRDWMEQPAESPAREIAKQQVVEVEVLQRPSTEFAVSPSPVAEQPQALAVTETEPMVAQESAPCGSAAVLDREEEELREIEIGIARYKRVVQINPRNAHAWDALGTLYKSAGLYKDAILAYQQAISNDGNRSLYYHHLGLVYACEGRDEDAICAFQKVIELDPDYSLAHATLGGYYRKMGLEDLAQKHIGKAMKNIFDSENEYNRACLEAICGNTEQAIELLGVALKNKQTYVDWILRDPDLDFIRQDPRFKTLISQYTR